MSDCAVCHRDLDAGVCCHLCQSRLASRLRDIPGLYGQVEVEAALATPPPAERTSGTGSHPVPMGLDILAALLLRAPMGGVMTTYPGSDFTEPAYWNCLDELEGWCRVIIEERDFTWPNYPPSTMRGRLTAACEFMFRHLEWLAEQTFVDEVARDVQVTHRLLRSAAAPDRSHAPTQIPCPGSVYDGPCGEGKFWRDLSTGALLCRACGAEYPPEGFWALAERMSEPVRLADVAGWCGVRENTIRQWLTRELLTNYGSEGRPRVLMGDVLAVHRGERVA